MMDWIGQDEKKMVILGGFAGLGHVGFCWWFTSVGFG